MNKLEELHLQVIQDCTIENYYPEYSSDISESLLITKSAEITEQIAVEFIEWCNYQIINPQKVLGFDKRVIPQYPDFKTYIILDDKGKNILPEGKFLTSKELFQEFLKQRQ